MKAILKFELPEEQYEFNMAITAHTMHTVIFDMHNFLRNKLKYESDNMSEDEYKAYEKCLETFNNIMSEEDFILR